ncbi:MULTISPECIES: hypothetical protein [Halorubrum]|uniref:Uncharacterized protein n=1 Tax=Halorubrum sodomense TaxID=35743 RepID=A0A1I6H7K9_HALSD|nr:MULTISPECIES: hypothetical protein [Halorubrum]TKX55761.1 hypothetical protein EXE42_01830 [Halorubrum sp. SP3]TKX71456.1 hypothetical protein EXE45_00860 [Halorubrum sp. SP9]SFR50360.1 hypothetical protein SAMN04487937_2527 [Halorubrum sodomense]
MKRRTLLTASAGTVAVAAAGCLGSDPDPSRLDLTVRNDGDAPVDVEVTVTGDDGTTYEETSDRVDAGVARAFEVTVGATGRHEVAVTGADWEGRLAWDAGTCALYDGRVTVDAETVAVAGECVDPR